jgi:hypothetical protein
MHKFSLSDWADAWLRFVFGSCCLVLALEYSYYAFGFSDVFRSLSVFNGFYGYVGDVVFWFWASAILLWDALGKFKAFF